MTDTILGSSTTIFNLTFLLISKCIRTLNDQKSMILSISNNKQDEDDNLAELYLIDPNICIICRRHFKIETVHCIKCNICIDEWDHHCFWLNICVSKQNKKQFICFIILALFCIAFNLSLYGWIVISLIINYNENDSDSDLRSFVIIAYIIVFLILVANFVTLMM